MQHEWQWQWQWTHIKYAIYGNYGGSADTKGCFITALHCLVNEILKQSMVLIIIIITISIITQL